MRISVNLLAPVLLLGSLPATAAPRSPAPAKPAATAGVDRVEVFPSEVSLDSRRSTRQLVVTGYRGAEAFDLTGQAVFRPAREGVVRVAGGRVTPLADGRTTLQLLAGGKSLRVPVTVSNFSKPDPVRFKFETLPVLTKQGCASGSCHGSPHGKGGFSLSLFGYDPRVDQISLTRDGFNRRINVLEPEESLILKKPLLEVPHVGGKRLRKTDAAYGILRDWVYAGASTELPATECERIEIRPGPSRVLHAPHLEQQLSVLAYFSDGTVRDVTAISTYDSSQPGVASVDADGRITGRARGQAAVSIRYLDRLESFYVTVVEDVPGFVWKAPREQNWIDTRVNEKLRQLQYLPAPTCSDETFIRRVSLDLTGLLPSPERVRKFLLECGTHHGDTETRSGGEERETKRATEFPPTPRKQSPSLTKGGPGGVSPSRKPSATEASREVFPNPEPSPSSLQARAKLIDELLESEEYARFWALKKADLMRVSPKRLKDGSADAYAAWIVDAIRTNKPYDRFARELLTSAGAGKDVAPANYFLAIPTTEERTEMTAQLFMGSRVECAKCHNHPFEAWTMRDYYSISAVFARTQADRGTVRLANSGEIAHPTTHETLRPWGMTAAQASASPNADRRTFFAEWLTKPGNPYFARVEVNRIWADLLGKGIVDPVDDFRSSNPPSNVALLDALAKEFETSSYDRKRIIRFICNSQTYQRSTETNRFNQSDERLFSHARVRLLTAEQLKDAIAVATRALPAAPDEAQRPRYATERPYPETSSFTAAFGQPQRDTACTCERQTSPTLLQALELLNGGAAYGMVQAGAAKYAPLENDVLIDELYMAALCRRPRDKERATAKAYLAKAANRAEAVTDLVWTLVNTQEFLFQH